MTRRFAVVLTTVAVGFGSLAPAQPVESPEPPLVNWTAPPYWTPPLAQPAEGEPGGRMVASAQGMTAQAEALPSSPLPFTAITPCRVADTRGNGFTGAYGPPSLLAAVTRDFTIAGQCGIPPGAVAVSFNFTVVNGTLSGDLRFYPAGGSMPLVSTINWKATTGALANAAIVPLDTGGAITVKNDSAAAVDLVIDVNGYYGPSSVVTSLTGGASTLTGDVTLAEGANVTITPSGNTLTVAATGGPGGVLPAGTTSQTLYHNGSAWTASNALTSDGTNVWINGCLRMPATTSGGAAGMLSLGSSPFLHNYGPAGALNSFIGPQAGNFSMTGTTNTASGGYSFFSNTTGNDNTASGVESLYSNTKGSSNTAIGLVSLYSNTEGSDNTAVGYQSLYSNLKGSFNIGIGYGGGSLLSTGSYNIAIGNYGVAGESSTIRIGHSPDQTRAFIAGVRGVTTGNANAVAVVIDSAGQLGTVSSSIRFKRDVADMGDASSRLMELRPVTFHYKAQPGGPIQYGLIAEEVQRVMPELVVRDATGQIETIAYHELPAMLLNEVQKQQATIQAQQAQIEELRRQVQILMEARSASGNTGAAKL